MKMTKQKISKEKYQELEPTPDFLNKLIGKRVKVFYSAIEDGKVKEPKWLEGTLTGHNEFTITLESETDYLKIELGGIERLYPFPK